MGEEKSNDCCLQLTRLKLCFSFGGKAIIFNILPFVSVIAVLFLTHLLILAAFLLIVE